MLSELRTLTIQPRNLPYPFVIPAQAGIRPTIGSRADRQYGLVARQGVHFRIDQRTLPQLGRIPAFAGMTELRRAMITCSVPSQGALP